MADMDSDMTSEKYDWFGWMILTAFIFTGLGYCYRYAQDINEYYRGYEDAITELEVLVKGDLCK